MSDIQIGIRQIEPPAREIGLALIKFLDTIKGLEKSAERGGKQATKIVMTMNDIMDIVKQHTQPDTVVINHVFNLAILVMEQLELISNENTIAVNQNLINTAMIKQRALLETLYKHLGK